VRKGALIRVRGGDTAARSRGIRLSRSRAPGESPRGLSTLADATSHGGGLTVEHHFSFSVPPRLTFQAMGGGHVVERAPPYHAASCHARIGAMDGDEFASAEESTGPTAALPLVCDDDLCDDGL